MKTLLPLLALLAVLALPFARPATASAPLAPPPPLVGVSYCNPQLPVLPNPTCPNLDADCALMAANQYYDDVMSAYGAACSAWTEGYMTWNNNRLQIQFAFEDCVYQAAQAGTSDAHCHAEEQAATAANNRQWGALEIQIDETLDAALEAALKAYNRKIASECCG